MCKKIIYGIEFDTEKDGDFKRLRSGISMAYTKAFVEVKRMGVATCDCNVLDILVNERMKGRLNLDSYREADWMINSITKARRNGMTFKDIVILRSLAFSFDEIEEIAAAKKTADDVIEEEGIENPEIENVLDITSKNLKEWYVSYDTVKEMVSL